MRRNAAYKKGSAPTVNVKAHCKMSASALSAAATSPKPKYVAI